MDLLTIVAPAAEVPIAGGQSVTVRGLSLRAIAALLGRFPDVLALFNGRDLDAQKLLVAAPDAAAAIMAAGAGHLGDSAAEVVCDGLGLEYQTNLLAKIGELTFPGGIGPFAERIAQLSSSLPDLQRTNGAAAPDHEMPATN